MSTPQALASSAHSAVFIDYENIYYYLKNTYSAPPDLGNYTGEIVRGLRQHLEEQRMEVVMINAYADFERLGTGSINNSMSQLYLMGIEIRYVLGTQHKNAADMQMCIDLLQNLYTRTEIAAFVLVAGDRDYIPVVKHLKRHGKQVLVAAFRGTLSGDLLEIIGESSFIDIAPFISQGSLDKLTVHHAEAEELRLKEEEKTKGDSPLRILGKIDLEALQPKPHVPAPNAPVTHAKIRSNIGARATECLKHILHFVETKGFKEPGLGPLLRYLTEEMPLLANWERKDLIEQLQSAGVLTIATRQGYEYNFSVVVLNYEHPLVKAAK